MTRLRTLLFIGLSSITLWLANNAPAQVEHRDLFKPQSVIPVQAPPPVNVESRREAFSARNSPTATKALAGELFGMMTLDWVPEVEALRTPYQEAAADYRAGRYAEALDAYKRFFIQRILDSKDKGQDPSQRTFIEYFTEADGLMKGQAKVAALTQDYPPKIAEQGIDAMLNHYRAGLLDPYHVLLDIQIGEPGEVNWTWSLKDYYGSTWHMPRDESYLSFAFGAAPDFFTPLVGGYLNTGDVAYLKRWAEYVDDFHMNFIPDVQHTQWADKLNWTAISGPGIRPLVFALRQRPETLEAIPASTLARMVLHIWKANIPVQIQNSRTAGPNRRLTMYGRQMNSFFFQYPELAEGSYLLRQRRRTLEDHARVSIHPDGGDQILALPYFDQYYTTPPMDIAELRGLPDAPWLTDRWVQELRRTQNLVGSYMLRTLEPSGRQAGHRDPFRSIYEAKGLNKGKNSLADLLPEMMAVPENQAILRWHGKDRAVQPPLRAFAFPYSGAYYIWSDWSDQPQFMHLTSQRPGTRNRWRFNNNISLTAFGQLMLFYSAEDYVLEVDGIGGLAGVDTRALPSLTPQPNRFLCSDHFDFMEGFMSDESRQRVDPKTGAKESLGKIDHRRQVLFVREAGVWIVTDRIAGDRSHAYRVLWPFRGDFAFNYGSEDIRRRKRLPSADSYLHGYRPAEDFVFDEKKQAIRTVNPHIPNLSIYHASNAKLTLPKGEFVQHDWRFGNALCTGPRIEGAKSTVLASLIFPRKNHEVDMKSFQQVTEAGATGFDAETPEGAKISYRAAGETAGKLKIEGIEAEAESLLVSSLPGDSTVRGVVLGGSSFTLQGAKQNPPGADFTFARRQDGSITYEPIRYPMGMVKIEPGADRFVEKLTVKLSHPEPGVQIRYTLDGSLPKADSPLYKGPFEIRDTTWVTAIAVRKGVDRLVDSTDSIHYSLPHWAVYEKEQYREPAVAKRAPNAASGVSVSYKETQHPISMLNFRSLLEKQCGAAPALFDLSLRAGADPVSNYGFKYSGYIEVPKEGVYEIHAPEEFVNAVIEAWYDLRVFIDGEEWYPATRRQNYGAWSIPLKAGSHKLEVEWVDQRPSMGIVQGKRPAGTFTQWVEKAPVLEISGPDLARGAPKRFFLKN